MADRITGLAENLKKTGPQHDAKVHSMPPASLLHTSLLCTDRHRP
jgi:hypothetical protein